MKRPCKPIRQYAQKHTFTSFFFILLLCGLVLGFNFQCSSNCHLKKTSIYSMIDNPKYKIVCIVIFEMNKKEMIPNAFYRSFVSINLAKSTFVAHKKAPGIKFDRNRFCIHRHVYELLFNVHHSGCCFLLADAHVYCLPGTHTHTSTFALHSHFQ